MINTFESCFVLLMFKQANNVIFKPCVAHGVYDNGMFIDAVRLQYMGKTFIFISSELNIY